MMKNHNESSVFNERQEFLLISRKKNFNSYIKSLKEVKNIENHEKTKENTEFQDNSSLFLPQIVIEIDVFLEKNRKNQDYDDFKNTIYMINQYYNHYIIKSNLSFSFKKSSLNTSTSLLFLCIFNYFLEKKSELHFEIKDEETISQILFIINHIYENSSVYIDEIENSILDKIISICCIVSEFYIEFNKFGRILVVLFSILNVVFNKINKKNENLYFFQNTYDFLCLFINRVEINTDNNEILLGFLLFFLNFEGYSLKNNHQLNFNDFNQEKERFYLIFHHIFLETNISSNNLLTILNLLSTFLNKNQTFYINLTLFTVNPNEKSLILKKIIFLSKFDSSFLKPTTTLSSSEDSYLISFFSLVCLLEVSYYCHDYVPYWKEILEMIGFNIRIICKILKEIVIDKVYDIDNQEFLSRIRKIDNSSIYLGNKEKYRRLFNFSYLITSILLNIIIIDKENKENKEKIMIFHEILEMNSTILDYSKEILRHIVNNYSFLNKTVEKRLLLENIEVQIVIYEFLFKSAVEENYKGKSILISNIFYIKTDIYWYFIEILKLIHEEKNEYQLLTSKEGFAYEIVMSLLKIFIFLYESGFLNIEKWRIPIRFLCKLEIVEIVKVMKEEYDNHKEIKGLCCRLNQYFIREMINYDDNDEDWDEDI